MYQKEDNSKYHNLGYGQVAERKALPQKQSEYSPQYAHFFQGLAEELPSSSAIVQMLSQHSISYSPSILHQSEPSIIVESKSRNSEIVNLTIKWGRFIQKISVINFLGQNPLIKPENEQENRRTIIYHRKYGNKKVMFKSKFLHPENRSQDILSVLKEVFIGKIASSLEFGPICCHQTSFDILLYQNSIEFCMEKCIGSIERSFRRLNTDSLRSGLRLMHSLQLVHFDIKPQNIMFSEGLGKLVMIDFDLSEVTDFIIGMKAPIPFCGTLNFCCPEMVQNFVLKDNYNFVDPYYNDVHCLTEALRFMKVQPIEGNYGQQDEQSDKIYQQWFLILKLKHLLYTEQWEKASALFAKNQKLFVRSVQEVMQFMYELHLSQGLKSFYISQLPACQRDTLFMREFNHRLSKKIVMNMDVQYGLSEKKMQFQYRLLIDNLKMEVLYRKNGKKECRQFLENQQKFMSEMELYFHAFLDYVSLHHNQYKVDARERNQMAIIFHQFIKKCKPKSDHQQTNSSYSLGQEISHKAMDTVLRFILEQTICRLRHQKSSNFNQSPQKSIILREIVRKLLLFIFILDLGSLEQNLRWFDELISSFTDSLDRLALIYSLKHLNHCNQYRISGKKSGNSSRYTTYIRIREFCYFRLTKQKKNISIELYNFIQQGTSNIGLDFLDNTSLISHGWLKEQLAIAKMIKMSTMNLFNLNLQKMVQQALALIGKSGSASFKPAYLSLYHSFRIFGNVNIYHLLYKAFSQNLNDRVLQKQFSIYYFHQQLTPIIPSSFESMIDRYKQHLFKTEREDFLLQATFFDEILLFWEYVRGYRSLWPNSTYLRLISKLRVIQQRHDELTAYYHQVKKDLLASSKIHICFGAANYFSIYLSEMKKYGTIQECQEFLKESKELQYYRRCKRCLFALSVLHLNNLHIWVLFKLPQDSRRIIGELNEYYKYVCKLAEDPECQQQARIFEGVDVQILLNNTIFSNFIWNDDSKHQGVIALYQIITYKKKKLNQEYSWVYFALRNMLCQILLNEATLIGLFRHDPPKCSDFLKMMAEYCQKYRTQSNHNVILRSFQGFIQKLSQESRVNVYNQLRHSLRRVGSKMVSFRVYFYVLAQCIQEPSLQRNAYAFIARSIQDTPFDFQSYYSSVIHRHFVKRLRRQGKQYTRQEIYLNNKLVKLFIQLNKNAANKKLHSNFSIPMKGLLINKIGKLGGSFIIEEEKEISFSFQRKRRVKAT